VNVAVMVFDGVELVDMNGPVDVFLHANRYETRFAYAIHTVAATHRPFRSEGDVVTITPAYSVDDCPEPDIVVVPGRIPSGTTAGPELTAWLVRMSEAGKTILSVCVGIYTLAEAGLLKHRRATTHYLAVADVHRKYPDIDLMKNVRFVEDGQFLTTGGVTSGIDGALELVGCFSGAAVAQNVADVMVYNTTCPLPPGTLLPPVAS
jgi:transcriptional regulator GlxA family with amidase domain